MKVEASLVCSCQEMLEYRSICSRHRAISSITALDFRRTTFGLFKELLGEVPWVLAGRGAQAQEQSIPKIKKSSKRDRIVAQLGRELLNKFSNMEEGYDHLGGIQECCQRM